MGECSFLIRSQLGFTSFCNGGVFFGFVFEKIVVFSGGFWLLVAFWFLVAFGF